MGEEEKQTNESWLDFFKRKGRFGDCILYAWSAIEENIDIAFIAEFGLLGRLGPKASMGIPFDDTDQYSKKRKLLLDIPFGKRMEFLYRTGVIKNEEFAVLRKFQKDRNRFFHGRNPSFVRLSSTEKDEIMGRAREATIASFDVAERSVAADIVSSTIGFRVPSGE